MNYLDFARKIMLYLQLRGILFKFSIETTADISSIIENKNGEPFEFSIEEKSGVDINAINGDGLIVNVEEITADGEVKTSIVAATADVIRVGNIEAKAQTLTEAVLGQALSSSFAVSDCSAASVMFEPFGAVPMMFTAETQAAITALMADASGIIARLSEGAEVENSMIETLVSATLARFAVSNKGSVKFTADSGNALVGEFNAIDGSAMQVAIMLMMDAVLSDYENISLSEMGGSTLEELSKRIL